MEDGYGELKKKARRREEWSRRTFVRAGRQIFFWEADSLKKIVQQNCRITYLWLPNALMDILKLFIQLSHLSWLSLSSKHNLSKKKTDLGSAKSILKQLNCRIWRNNKPETTSDGFGTHVLQLSISVFVCLSLCFSFCNCNWMNIYIVSLRDSEALQTQVSATTSKQDSLQAFPKNGKRKGEGLKTQLLRKIVPTRGAWLKRVRCVVGIVVSCDRHRQYDGLCRNSLPVSVSRTCLSLIVDENPQIKQEQDLIEAVSMLEGFCVSILPVQGEMMSGYSWVDLEMTLRWSWDDLETIFRWSWDNLEMIYAEI